MDVGEDKMDVIDYTKQPYCYYSWVDCPSCSGERGSKGRIRRYKHIADGKCFTCNGQGTLDIKDAIEITDDFLRLLWRSDSEYKVNPMSFHEYKLHYFSKGEINLFDDDLDFFD